MHVADFDDLINVHSVMSAYFCQFVCESNVHRPERVLHNLCHLCRSDIRHHNLSLAERSIQFFYPLSHFPVIRADCPVVVQKLIYHIAGNNPLGRMNQMYILSRLQSQFLNDWSHALVNSTR